MVASEEVLTPREAWELLQVGRNAFYEAVARGEIPHVRIGRSIRVPRAALERWLERTALAATAGELRQAN